MQVSQRHGELSIAVFLLAVAGFFVWNAWKMPAGAAGMPGPGTFPLVLGSLLAIASVAVLVKSLRARAAEAATPADMRLQPVVIIYAALVAVAVALDRAGFIVTLGVFMFVMLRVFSRLGTWRSALAAVAATLIASWLFVNLLGVSLPRW